MFASSLVIGAVVVLLVSAAVLGPWLKARGLGVRVSLLTIVGMRLRRNPPRLLLDAYAQLCAGGTRCTLAQVEWAFIEHRNRVSNAGDLATIVRETPEEYQDCATLTDRTSPTLAEQRIAPPSPADRAKESTPDAKQQSQAREYVERAEDLSCHDDEPGNLEQALAMYNKAIELEPGLLEAYLGRGNLYDELDRYDEAIADFTAAIRIGPESAQAYRDRARIHEYRDEYKLARADYDRAIEVAPHDAEGYQQRGSFLACLEQWSEALADYNSAARIDPHDRDVYYHRGVAHLRLDRLLEAVADFTESLRLNPNSSVTYSYRGETYLRLDQLDEAIADLSKSIKIDPEYANTYELRAEAYRKTGDFNRADRDQARAHEKRGGTI